MDDKKSLVAAMKGAHAVFAVTNYWEKMDDKLEVQQGKDLADAAKETGVQHFIFSSLVDVKKRKFTTPRDPHYSPPVLLTTLAVTNGKLSKVYHFDSKAKIEQYVREIGIPATFFLPGFFMSNIPGQMLREMSPGNWTLALPMPDTAPIPLFAPELDSGKFLKAIVLNREKLLGRQVLAATAYVTPAQIVASFKKAFPEAGKTASFYRLPHDQFLGAMRGAGLPDFAAEELLENMRLMDEGGYYGGESLDASLALLDDKPTTWDEYIKESKVFAELK